MSSGDLSDTLDLAGVAETPQNSAKTNLSANSGKLFYKGSSSISMKDKPTANGEPFISS